MASGVHAVALRLKQAKKKKMLQDQQQTLGSLKPPQDKTASVRIVEPTRSPRRSHQGTDAASDTSGTEGKTTSNVDHRQMADKAYKKWMKKQKGNTDEFRRSYIAAGELAQFDLLLWSGLGVLMTGTVVSFVGLGEKGFRTNYLRFVGPILCGTGLAMVIIRIAICCVRGKKKAVFNVKDQLSKVVHVQQAVAARSIQFKTGEGPSIIPSIQIDPSCDSAMRSCATAATELSPEGSPVLSGENVPLIQCRSTENTPTQHMTTAVIENDWLSKQTDQESEPTDRWRKLVESSPELARNTCSLTEQEVFSSSLSPPYLSSGLEAQEHQSSKLNENF